MISNHEIDAYVSKDPFISRIYGGTLAINELPSLKQPHPRIFIVNTDPSYKPGTHWLAVYVHERSEHFDSAGQEPVLPRLDSFLLKQSPHKGYIYNSNRIQSTTSFTCGLFCLMYAYYRSRGVSYSSFLSMFTYSDLEQNETVVKYFYRMTK